MDSSNWNNIHNIHTLFISIQGGDNLMSIKKYYRGDKNVE